MDVQRTYSRYCSKLYSALIPQYWSSRCCVFDKRRRHMRSLPLTRNYYENHEQELPHGKPEDTSDNVWTEIERIGKRELKDTRQGYKLKKEECVAIRWLELDERGEGLWDNYDWNTRVSCGLSRCLCWRKENSYWINMARLVSHENLCADFCLGLWI